MPHPAPSTRAPACSCGRAAYARGLCARCYGRARRAGRRDLALTVGERREAELLAVVCEGEASWAELLAELGWPKWTLAKWLRRLRDAGEIERDPAGVYRRAGA